MKQALLSLFFFVASVASKLHLGVDEKELDTGSVYLFPVIYLPLGMSCQ